MNSSERNKAILNKYIPAGGVDIISDWIFRFDFKLKIKKERSSKLGDYRPPTKTTNHQITINRNLNKYAFLITLVHEIAHLTSWNKYQNKVKPHGQEWKHEFKVLMAVFIGKEIFPVEVAKALNSYMKNPAASSCSDIQLSRVLKTYDQAKGILLLEQLSDKSVFKYNGERTFIKGKKIRTRYKCMELRTKRHYLFSPITEVTLHTFD